MRTRTTVRSLFPCTLLLGAALAQHSVVAQDAAGVPAPDQLTTTLLDTRDLMRREPYYLPATALDATLRPFASDASDDPTPPFEPGDLVSLLLVSTDISYWSDTEGAQMRPTDTGFVSIRCHQQQHVEVRRVLAELRRLTFEPLVVEVHELPGSVLAERGAVLSREQFDAVVAEAGAHRVHVGRANTRLPLLLESKHKYNQVAGVHVKVAQEASAPELDVRTVDAGASWVVRTMRSVGGAMLVSVVGCERTRDEATSSERRVPIGDGATSAQLHLNAMRIATYRASAYLRPGEAMLFGADAPGANVLCVRVTGATPKPQGWTMVGRLAAYPIESLTHGHVSAANVPLPFEDEWLFGDDDEEPMPAVVDADQLIEMLTSTICPELWDGSPHTIHSEAGTLWVDADEGVRREVLQRLVEMHEVDARQFSLEVRFGELPAGQGLDLADGGAARLAATLPQRCLSVLSASRGTRISATHHVPIVRRYDATVASGVAATVPEFGAVVSGYLLDASIASAGDERALLDVQLTRLVAGDRSGSVELGHPQLGVLDRVDVRENKVRGATGVALDEWTLLHVAPVEGAPGEGQQPGALFCVVARVHAL